MIKIPAYFPSSENDFWEVMDIISGGRHVIVEHDIHTYEYKMSDKDNYVKRKIINSSNIMSVGGLPVIVHHSGDNDYHLLDIRAFSRNDKSRKNYQIIK